MQQANPPLPRQEPFLGEIYCGPRLLLWSSLVFCFLPSGGIFPSPRPCRLKYSLGRLANGIYTCGFPGGFRPTGDIGNRLVSGYGFTGFCNVRCLLVFVGDPRVATLPKPVCHLARVSVFLPCVGGLTRTPNNLVSHNLPVKLFWTRILQDAYIQ